MVLKSTPEISINPLVEYIEASDRRRKSIIRQQKNPSDFIISRYRTARSAFAKFFKEGFDEQVLRRAIERLQTKEQKSDWTRNDTLNSIEALRSFLEMEFPFNNLRCKFVKPDTKVYNINGVAITVAPDLLLEWEDGNRRFSGAIKFYIKKKPLSIRQGRLASALLADFIGRTSCEGTIVSNSHCMCIDVRNKRIFNASDDVEEDMSVVFEICNEIRNNWLVG